MQFGESIFPFFFLSGKYIRNRIIREHKSFKFNIAIHTKKSSQIIIKWSLGSQNVTAERILSKQILENLTTTKDVDKSILQ